jgi:hypothetical protein
MFFSNAELQVGDSISSVLDISVNLQTITYDTKSVSLSAVPSLIPAGGDSFRDGFTLNFRVIRLK